MPFSVRIAVLTAVAIVGGAAGVALLSPEERAQYVMWASRAAGSIARTAGRFAMNAEVAAHELVSEGAL